MNIALTVKSGEAWLQDKIDAGITLIEETAAPDTSFNVPAWRRRQLARCAPDVLNAIIATNEAAGYVLHGGHALANAKLVFVSASHFPE